MWKYKVSSKTKKIFLGPKMLHLGLWAEMLKNYCHICNQHPPIYLMTKIRAKIRILKFGNKNALFGCFGQQFWKTIVIVIVRFGAKNKNPLVSDQKCQTCVFWRSNLSILLSYLKSAPANSPNYKISRNNENA